jgi:tetratricopeptide (TPR) repeat protein
MADERQPGLRELLAIAQAALEAGRHREATVACRHILRDYPDAITAMRLLGESYLEAGRPDEAARAFERVLASDPFNVLARVGLGVLAEDRGDDDRAIAQFHLAWEVRPTLPQLRSELVRLYRKRYGVGGRLRMTRVSLANLHAHNEDLPRAIRQFRRLHGEEPARLDVAIGLAEALWRHGDDAEAQALCRALLATRASLARPLLILAASLGDQPQTGDAAAEADAFLPTARALDPDAALAAELAERRPSHTLQRFVEAPPSMTPFDPATLTAAGADEPPAERTSALGVDSFRWEDVAGGLAGEGILSKGGAKPGTGGLQANDEVDALFAAIDRQLATNGPPAAPVVAGPGEPLALTAPLAAWDDAPDDGMAPAPDEPTAVERLTADWDNIDNELAAARPGDDLPVGMTGMLDALEEELKPFDVESDAEPDEESTITFDPSKFSLPPLDGEDEDELDPAFDTGALGEGIAPFDLDEVSPRIKTGGLTFAELVRQERQAPEGTDAVVDTDPQAALADSTSIFATRELDGISNEDWLIDMQAAVEGAIAAPQGAETADDDLGGAFVPPVEATVPTARTSETLFGHERPQVDLPDAARAPGLTRPLLAPELSYEPGMPLAQQQPPATERDDQDGIAPTANPTTVQQQIPAIEREDAASESPARSRRHDQIPLTTEELARQGAQAFESVGQPAPDDEAPDDAIPDGAMLAAWVRGDTTAVDRSRGGTPDALAPNATDAANLDDWMMSFSDEDPGGRASQPPDGGDDALLDDDWLAGLAVPPAPSTDAPTPAPPETSFAARLDPPPSAPAAPPPGTPTPAPEEPAPHRSAQPPTSPPIPLPQREPSHESPPASWDDALPLVASANGLQAAGGGAQAHTNGHRPSAPAPLPMPHEEPAPARDTARDRGDQLAILESLVAAEPGNHFARLTLAVAYGDGQPERALNEYRRLIKESDEVLPEVIERLKEMLADGGAPARAHRVLGDAYMKQGTFDLAMAEFQRALTNRLR